MDKKHVSAESLRKKTYRKPMNQYEQLVESVAIKLWDKERYISPGWDYVKHYSFDKLPDATKTLFRKQAEEILSYPGLALIQDTEKDQIDCITAKSPDGTTKEYYPAIPIKELKEEE